MFPTFVGLVHLPRIGPTFLTALSGLKISQHSSPEFLLSQPWLPRFLLINESLFRYGNDIDNFLGLGDRLQVWQVILHSVQR